MSSKNFETPRILYRDEFTRTGWRQGRQPQVITRAWNDSRAASTQFLDMPLNERRSIDRDRYISNTLNFSELMKTVRLLETGQHHTMLLGKTAWNIIAEINNDGLSALEPDFLISWSEGIHPDLRNGEYRRGRAAERLQIAYAELAQVAVVSSAAIEI